ncbi:MAG: hypothetical protein WB764_22525 [Xanthobacteraceae bacterium]
MLHDLADATSAGTILMLLAPFAFVAAGFTLMFGYRRFALRLIVLGIFLAAASVVIPRLIQ